MSEFTEAEKAHIAEMSKLGAELGRVWMVTARVVAAGVKLGLDIGGEGFLPDDPPDVESAKRLIMEAIPDLRLLAKWLGNAEAAHAAVVDAALDRRRK